MSKYSFKAGDKIIIELHAGRQIEGEFVKDDSIGIVVKNPKNLATGKVRRVNQNFFNSEIKSIILVPIENSTSNKNNNATEITSCSFKRLVNGEIEKKSLSKQEIEDIQDHIRSAVYIAQFDEKYHSAIADIMRQEIITVISSNKYGRLDIKRPLLTLSTTSKKVYILDMLRLGEMKNELKNVFVSEIPRKIMHSSSEISDYLENKENCKLNNVLDTLMFHFNFTQKRQPIKLHECYVTYFELPDDFILQTINYDIRPLPKEALVHAALNSLMLMKLYWRMNDILMKPLYVASTQFANIYPTVENSVDLMVHINKREYPGIENVELNAVQEIDLIANDLIQL